MKPGNLPEKAWCQHQRSDEIGADDKRRTISTDLSRSMRHGGQRPLLGEAFFLCVPGRAHRLVGKGMRSQPKSWQPELNRR
jgi:hypothetical protein